MNYDKATFWCALAATIWFWKTSNLKNERLGKRIGLLLAVFVGVFAILYVPFMLLFTIFARRH